MSKPAPAPPSRFTRLSDMAEGLDWLRATDPRMDHAVRAAGLFPKRLAPGGFTALLRGIVFQQISIASATAVWCRIEDGLGTVSPQTVLDKGEAGMATLGLSRPKARYAVALAQHVISGQLPFRKFSVMSDAEVTERLVAVPGIGPWTADIYLLVHLGRPDAFPAADIALQEAVRQLYGLDERPDARQVMPHTEKWAPYRAVAARVLWHYYAHIKSRK